jgi:hypothetical protein
MNKEARWIIAFIVLLLAVLAWSDDFVTLQGERTIYTVRCEGAPWRGMSCPGRLIAAERFRFRALKGRREVIFWELGSTDPSGKFAGCDIKDGRNWACKPDAEAARSIALVMAGGRPQHDATGATRPFQAISKWKWWLLYYGIGSFKRADY